MTASDQPIGILNSPERSIFAPTNQRTVTSPNFRKRRSVISRARRKYSEQSRRGDHICYISDLGKLRAHYPKWRLTKSLAAIYEELACAGEGKT